ncbi:hypothetical protein [Streptomyces sp. NPDC058964]|uniref:hypothetical protein n=1 Tax=Streptomyces sp. NPDC058964 TaxID=3346681 RepID=UPI0036BEC93A
MGDETGQGRIATLDAVVGNGTLDGLGLADEQDAFTGPGDGGIKLVVLEQHRPGRPAVTGYACARAFSSSSLAAGDDRAVALSAAAGP